MAVVLIIDDSPTELHLFQNMLEKSGFETLVADSGEEGIRQAQTSLPDCILMDVIMPGMDGISMMKRIREIDSDLPVILITGQGDIPTAVQAIRDGAYDFLEKPFSGEVLMEVVHRAMEKLNALGIQGPHKKRMIFRLGDCPD